MAAIILVETLTNGVISKTSFLSFPQAKRVGNPSENKERFRTSRNDRMTSGCGFTDDFLNSLILMVRDNTERRLSYVKD